MTVPVSDRLSQLYVGNGANVRFDFNFRVFQQEDDTGIAVRKKESIDFETIDPSTYTVTVNQDGMGGYITFNIAPNTGTYFYIAGKTTLDQLLDITNYDNFYPDALERALDKLTALLQEWGTQLDIEKQARILADIHYDSLAMEREENLENRLISYINSVIGITNPAIFDGISDRMIITEDGRTQRELNASIPFLNEDYSQFKQETYLREEQILDHMDEKDQALQSGIDTEVLRATGIENGLQIQINAIGVGNKSYKTYADMDADKANIPAKSKVTVTNDATSSNNGDWQWDGSTFTKSIYDPLTQAKAYTDSFDSLKLNKGKVYPFNAISRNGIISSASTDWNNFILDVRVNNADPTKYYQIAYQQNGALINGKNEYNWIIYEFDKVTYNTSAVAVLLVNYTDAGQQQLVKNGTIQTVNIKSLVKPELSFTITCDTSALPVGTSPINSTAPGSNSWSHIIDQSCYVYEDANLLTKSKAPRDWLINKGTYYPFVSANYKGVTSPSNTILLDAIKDIVVENAEDGYVYQLAYYTNGSTAAGANYQERWIINKRLESNYSDTAATESQIVALAMIQPVLTHSGNIETIILQSSGLEKFHITVDTAKLPAYGTYISSVSGQGGYSWYVTKNNYIYNIKRNLKSYFKWSIGTKSFKYRFETRGIVYEWTFGENGANNLPNFKEIDAAVSENLLTNNLLPLTTFSTDWLPPLVFYVVNNADDSNISAFTGGNHASNGDATGDPTAINELFSIFIDGQQIDMSKDFACFCDVVDVKIVNKLMASNTKTTSKRYALKQIFDVGFSGQNVDVHCKLRALEDIRLRSDYGPQLTTDGFRSSQLILDGQEVNRVAYNNNATSGARSQYPNANALLLKGSGHILSSWIDRTYGNGKPENCAPDQPLIRGGTATNHKFYHCAFRSMLSDETAFPPLLLTPSNTDYKWRGGYVLKRDDVISGFDSVLRLKDMTSVINGVNYY